MTHPAVLISQEYNRRGVTIMAEYFSENTVTYFRL